MQKGIHSLQKNMEDKMGLGRCKRSIIFGQPFQDEPQADSQVDRDKSETRKEQKWCTFENDTKYTVMITDKDGTRPLKPGKSTTNVGIPGFEMILVLKLPKKDAKLEFPLSGFNNSRQKISQIFAHEINQN
ncbi:uncharacterized protein LOC111328757 [Stylophora pistillata]|nr:uncharacterized protein LOC111328757 [Stylophora pistillata]